MEDTQNIASTSSLHQVIILLFLGLSGTSARAQEQSGVRQLHIVAVTLGMQEMI